MPDIKTGDRITTEWWPESVEAEDSGQLTDITSTTFVTGSPVVATTFVAARTGRAAIAVCGAPTESVAGSQIFLTFQLYQGTSASGTLIQDAEEALGISSVGDTTAGGSVEMAWGNLHMVEELEPGETYYVRLVHRVESGSTNDLRARRVTVIPLP